VYQMFTIIHYIRRYSFTYSDYRHDPEKLKTAAVIHLDK